MQACSRVEARRGLLPSTFLFWREITVLACCLSKNTGGTVNVSAGSCTTDWTYLPTLIQWQAEFSTCFVRLPESEYLLFFSYAEARLTCHTQQAAILTSFNCPPLFPLPTSQTTPFVSELCSLIWLHASPLTWLGGLNGCHDPSQKTQQSGRCGGGAHDDTEGVTQIWVKLSVR